MAPTSDTDETAGQSPQPHAMDGETAFLHEEGAEAEAPAPAPGHAASGVIYGVIAYAWWGFILSTYIWALGGRFASVTALELLAHRIIWGLPVLLAIIHLAGKWGDLAAIVRSRRSFGLLIATTALIAANWFTFTYGVVSGNTAEVAFGYYINPLVSIAMGMVFLGERMRPVQWFCVAIALVGVGVETAVLGRLPHLALIVACSFGTYGLLRKKAKADAVVGLTIEMALLWPLAVIGLVVLMAQRRADFLGSESPLWLSAALLPAGVMTIVPLLAFTAAARRLRLSTVGFLQYIAPSGQFVLAVVLFGESFPSGRWVSFGLIWLALAIFSVESLHASRARARQASPSA